MAKTLNARTAALLRLRAQIIEARRIGKKKISCTVADVASVIDDLQNFYSALETGKLNLDVSGDHQTVAGIQIDPNDPDSILGALGALAGKAVARNMTDAARGVLQNFGRRAFTVKKPGE